LAAGGVAADLAGAAGSAAALAGSAEDGAVAAVVAEGGKYLGAMVHGCAGAPCSNAQVHIERLNMQMTRSTAIRMLILVLALVPLTGCSYNKFVGQEEAIKAQWAQVENQLQRRNDLIPNLVETVKGYAQHEESVYKDIADARSKLLAAKSPEETIQAANQQTSALGRLLAVVENYPQLRANEQFNRLMDELSGTENRIATERMRYNEKVQEYNTSRRQFPGNVTAKVFGFKDYPFFEAPAEAKQVPKVNFSK
jgi:LemA protein